MVDMLLASHPPSMFRFNLKMTPSPQLLLILAICFLTHFSLQEVCIKPVADNHIPHSCKTLEEFCQESQSILYGGIVTFFSGTHWLMTTCEMKFIEHALVLRADIGSRPVVNCSDSGFRFLNVHNLKISGIEFIGCGSTWNITLPHFHGLILNNTLSALMFVNGSNLSLTNVTVSHAKSAGIFIYNVAGYVTVDSCKVDNASFNTHSFMSGNVIVYDSNADSRVHIDNSRFINNGYRKDLCEIDGHYLYSSGLALYLESSRVAVDIINSNFSLNTGCNGGNLALLLLNLHQ